MRLDTANRSFFTLVGMALGPYLLLGVFACGALSLAVWELVASGPAAVAGTPAGWGALGFLVVAALGALAAVRSLYRQASATRRLAAFVREHRVATPPQLERAASHNRVRVDLLDIGEPYAFTYGLRRPCVVVTSGLLATTSAAELDAVLAHERYHAANLDPLKTVIARVIPSAFFFLPVLTHLRHRYLVGRELAADRHALRRSGSGSIAGALYKTATAPTPSLLHTAAAIGGNELLEIRIAQLETGREPAVGAVPARTTALTAAGLVAATAGVAVTIRAAGELDVAAPTASPDLLGAAACGALWLAGGVALHRRFASRH